MATDEVSERLAMLCQMELAGGADALADAIGELSREDLESVLAEAVVALMDAQSAAEREVARMARRLQERHDTG